MAATLDDSTEFKRLASAKSDLLGRRVRLKRWSGEERDETIETKTRARELFREGWTQFHILDADDPDDGIF